MLGQLLAGAVALGHLLAGTVALGQLLAGAVALGQLLAGAVAAVSRYTGATAAVDNKTHNPANSVVSAWEEQKLREDTYLRGTSELQEDRAYDYGYNSGSPLLFF